MTSDSRKEPSGTARLTPLQKMFLSAAVYAVVALVELLQALIFTGFCRLAFGKGWLLETRFLLVFGLLAPLWLFRPRRVTADTTFQKRLLLAAGRGIAVAAALLLINWQWP